MLHHPTLRGGLAPMVLALAVAATLAPRSAQAAWPHDPYVGNVPLCTQPGNQSNPQMVSDGAGGTIVAWQDSRSATGPDIYVQRVSAAGIPLWTLDGVALCTAANDQSIPTVVSDGAGGAIVAWQDLRSGTNYDIYAQRVNASGSPLWTANGVAICQAALGQLSPRAMADGAGGTIVAWQDGRGASTDVYAQRLNASGTPQWTANGVPVCVATNTQYNADLVSDGAGGAILAWEDYRSGFADIYAQRVNAAGAPQWTTDGVVVCNATIDQQMPRAVSDGVGGMVVAWQDSRAGSSNFDVYAQRVNGSGQSQWTANGVALCAATGHQVTPQVATDGSGGAIAAWTDQRAGTNYDVYAQRVTAGGSTVWNANGTSICAMSLDQANPVVVPDGSGGAVIAWEDLRGGIAADVYAQRIDAAGATKWNSNGMLVSGASGAQIGLAACPDIGGGAIVSWRDFRNNTVPDVYVQRIEGYGELGNPEATNLKIRDIPNDQGGFVKVSWTASYLDNATNWTRLYYQVWRSVPPFSLTSGNQLLQRGVTRNPAEARAGGKLLLAPFGATDYAWEAVAWTNSGNLPSYSAVVATTSDSVAGSNPRTAYMVMTEWSLNNYEIWFSAPDSGYSVDNRGPVTPAPFAATYAAGTTHLTWNPNHETDLAGYRLYRGSGTGFVPSPANLVSAQADTGYVDAAGLPYTYKLTAVDVHGNESPAATVLPSGTTAVDDAGALALAFAAPSPNPARGVTTLHWSLPAATHVSVVVYDAAGRRVHTLHDGVDGAGSHTATFALVDDGGRALASGLYLVRFEAAGQSITRRVMAIR